MFFLEESVALNTVHKVENEEFENVHGLLHLCYTSESK